MDDATSPKKGWFARLRRPSPTLSVLTLLLVGFVAGIVSWGGFNTAVEATNKEAFCADCHVPKEWGPKMVRKVQASRELYGKLVGSIDTREKFEAKRLQLAEREWARMKANDSLECRNCHSMQSMDAEKQLPRARRAHELAVKNKDSCIDCHKGISHYKPQGMKEDDE